MGERIGTLMSLTFVVMKRPVVLMPFLAKIVEVIVKPLDPNIPNMRDSLLSSVTPALQDILKTYPAVKFQSSTQRLALGDNTGEVVVFDLKTGAPWQILEGTPKGRTVVSFSPDGKTIAHILPKMQQFVSGNRRPTCLG
ncbi:hypothetical protein M427DRAFT_136573 [Gonapodya prolifera JEL478]|uniref:WD40 repeat-like protein n=1 Tax=Gonapodya prolifera (strain JEL478) TaxID=1344416 RepID=A0A139A9F8_GONPJ|nr:hypothetical protein M427DRAFT_136573 [Gonapodya prolifera JEL478]|eukprot:KXS13396.1 hypothetical protein M427DRAFT_136573 [Gonapodya prolifera JEL478]